MRIHGERLLKGLKKSLAGVVSRLKGKAEENYMEAQGQERGAEADVVRG